MLYQFIALAVLVLVMGKIAAMHRQEPVLWGGVALILGLLAVYFLLLPFTQLLIAGVLCYILMRTYKSVVNK